MTMKNPTPKEQKYIQQKLLQVGLKIEAEAKKRCLHSRTDVLTPNGWKRINSLEEGDLVTTQNGEFKEIERIFTTNPDESRRIHLEGGLGLTTTKDHLIPIKGKGLVPAGNIEIGDKVKVLAGRCRYCNNLCEYDKEFCSRKCAGRYSYQEGNGKEGLKKGRRNAEKYAQERDNEKIREKQEKWKEENPKKVKEWHRKQSESLKQYYRENPEKHPNSICANKEMTSLEKKVKDLLEELDIKYEREFNVGSRWIDFALKDKKIFLECDGEYWHQDKKAEEKRDEEILLEKPNWKIIHLEEHEIKELTPKGLKDYIESGIGEINFIDRKVRKIEDKETHKYEPNFYDLVIDGGKGLFIANGILVHNCPVDTGRLRASINTQKTGKMQVQVGSNVEYAPYVEYGTSKMQAQPYLRPAVDQVLNNIHEFNTVKTNMR